ncbi:MAG: response regulator [Labilithrix sp.]|nr:response regulator [Labilithrix sp.]MCW5831318.1 response regulator [Labilithrix sp.]
MNREALRVLVVDEDIIIRHFFARALRRHAEVYEASRVVEACALLEATTFDVVVSDEHLSDGSGRALMALVRVTQPGCRRALMSNADAGDAEGEGPEPSFPKVGGLARLVAWVRAAPGVSGGA